MKLTFKNTKYLSQIDWDKEIANEKPLDEDAQGKRASEAVFVWNYVCRAFEGKPTEEAHNKANMLRVHEYFYAKFIYHHSLFYAKYHDKTIDVSAEILKKDRREVHVIAKMKKEFGNKIPKSNLPLETLHELEAAFTKEVRKMLKETAPKGNYNDAKKLFEAQGIKVTKPKGCPKYGDRDTICTIHDGVRYHMYVMKGETENRLKAVKEEVKDHNHIIERYHPLVKSIYQKIKKEIPGTENLWAMEGGGMQCQVFFGNENGYLGILYLDMKTAKAELKDQYTLQLQGKADALFKNFKMDGIKIQTCEEVYGKEFMKRHNLK